MRGPTRESCEAFSCRCHCQCRRRFPFEYPNQEAFTGSLTHSKAKFRGLLARLDCFWHWLSAFGPKMARKWSFIISKVQDGLSSDEVGAFHSGNVQPISSPLNNAIVIVGVVAVGGGAVD